MPYAKDTKRYISRVTPLYITKYLLTRILHFWMHRMLEYSGFPANIGIVFKLVVKSS
jgi:hypothetical protein